MAKKDIKDPGPLTRNRISKTNSRIMLTVGIAIGISIFSLVSIKALASKFSYQHQVLHARRATIGTLVSDKTAANSLIATYKSIFENSNPINIIGGKNDSSTSALPPDGDNARIVLDALPTTYDYPAVISSISYLLNSNSITSPSISGTDDSATAVNAPSASPIPVAITLTVAGNGSYAQIQSLINDFERSARPFDITNVQLSGNSSSMTFSLTVTTYYQPSRSFATGVKEVQ